MIDSESLLVHAQSARHAFSISQGSREQEGWVEQRRGAKTVRKDGRKTQRGRVVPALVHGVVGSACVLRRELSYCAERPLSVRITVIHVVRGRLHIGEGLFACVFVGIAGFVDTVGTCTCRRPAMAYLRILKLLGWLQIRFFTGPKDMMGEGLSTEKVDCMCLMLPGRAFWLVSQCRSFSSASRRILSVDWLRLKPGASSSWMLLQHSSKVSGHAQEAADRGGTHLPFSLSSLSLMYLEQALSDSTMRFWRRQSLQLRFSSRWPCLR